MVRLLDITPNPSMIEMKIRPWTLMFAGAFGCAILCLVMIYFITVTGNVSFEVIIYVLIFLGFGFAAGGYIIESRYKAEHPEEFLPILPDEE